MSDPIKRLERRPWWHSLVGLFLRWRGERRVRAEETRKRSEMRLVGYFVYNTTYTDTKQIVLHVWAAWKNDLGQRRVDLLSQQDFDRHKTHHYYSIVQAWLAGDDTLERLMNQRPTLTAAEWAAARAKLK